MSIEKLEFSSGWPFEWWANETKSDCLHSNGMPMHILMVKIYDGLNLVDWQPQLKVALEIIGFVYTKWCLKLNTFNSSVLGSRRTTSPAHGKSQLRHNLLRSHPQTLKLFNARGWGVHIVHLIKYFLLSMLSAPCSVQSGSRPNITAKVF